MDKRLQTAFGLGFGGLIALFAIHGRAFLDVLMALPDVATAFAARMPLGVWTLLLSGAISAGLYAFTLRWLPPRQNGMRPHFMAETLAIVAAIVASVAQQPGNDHGLLMRAVLMGMVAGFAAPWIIRGGEALFGRRKRAS